MATAINQGQALRCAGLRFLVASFSRGGKCATLALRLARMGNTRTMAARSFRSRSSSGYSGCSGAR